MPNIPTLVDTHCHIHEAEYLLPVDEVLQRARTNGVQQMLCIGTNETSSFEAVEFAAKHVNVFAIVGVHPHDAKDGYDTIAELVQHPRTVGIGEIGLDYFYTHSSRELQIRALEVQLQLASDNSLPVSFHVREAFGDFWPVIDNFPGIRGVLHSFTDTIAELEKGLSRGLYVGVNGISTFTKDEGQKAMFMAIPLDRLLLETDAPFLTPVPFRGKVNEPGLVKEVALHYARMRGIAYDELARQTTANAKTLFDLA